MLSLPHLGKTTPYTLNYLTYYITIPYNSEITITLPSKQRQFTKYQFHHWPMTGAKCTFSTDCNSDKSRKRICRAKLKEQVLSPLN